MTKIIEQFKMKKLAKKIAGVTLGAVALGAMSMSPVYATEEPRPGYLHGVSEESTGVYVGTGAVTISDASPGTLLANGMKIYGNTTGVTGLVTAANFDSSGTSGVTGLEIWGGWSNVDGVKGIDNKVIWSDSAKVNNIKTITGFEASANEVSATGTTVELTGATVADSGKVYGDYVESGSGKATATDTQVTLTKTKIGTQADVHGANVKSGSGDATATGTTLTLTNITTEGNGNVWGAKVDGAKSATATGTTVNMTGGNVSANDFFGVDVGNQSTDKAEATGTTLTINGATLESKVYGARVNSSADAKANNTVVTITDGELKSYPLNAAEVRTNNGGLGQANSTTLIINRTKIDLGDEHILGAEVSANAGEEILSAESTTVRLLNLPAGSRMGELTGVSIHSDTGHSAAASATVDTTIVEMNNGNVKDVVGTKIDHVKKVETKNKTSVTLNNVTAESVTGVHIKDTSPDHQINEMTVTANNTELTINGTTVEGDVTGIRANANNTRAITITATNTQVIFEDKDAASTVTGTVYGVDVNSGSGDATAKRTKVTLNKVTLNDNTQIGENGKIYGAYVKSTSGNATATVTTVKLNDTTVANNGNVYGANVTSTSGNATAKHTKVTLNKVTLNDNTQIGKNGKIYGAYVKSGSGDATATGTTLTLNNITTEGNNNIWGAKVKSETSATATNTKVNMTGGNVKANFYGVDVEVTNTTGVAEVTNTKLTFNGATVTGNVAGVRANANNTGTITATNTQVIFEGDASTVKGTVYGVNLTSKTSSETALTIRNTGNTIGNIANFDTINFVLPSNIQDDKAILTLTTSEETDLTSTKLTIDATRANLNGKDKVLLIDKEKKDGALNLNDDTKGAKVIFVENATTFKTGTYAIVDTNDLVLNISKGGEKPQDVVDNEKSLTETIAASVALLNSGADFATEQALGQAKAAAREGVKEGTREMMTFAAFGGSSMKYKSGSHIDAKGWNAAVGFAKEQGELTYGIAVEHGQANFDSYVNAAHGEGKNKYTGGVIFAELKKKSGVHFDASFRAGRAENDYNANLSVLGISTPTNYDISATYLGFSLGGGKEMKVSETRTIDLYGRYYFNHLNGANAKTNSGIDIDFKDSDSSRLRLGTRYTQKVDEYNKLYAGLAWQYEFAGKAKAVVNGTDAPSPSLKGHSAMLELGIKSKAGKNLNIDLGLNSWVGKQRGIGGNISFKWSF